MGEPPAPDRRVGASLDIRFDRSITEFVRFVTGRGLDHVELRWEYADINGGPDPERLRDLAERFGVSFTVHAPHVDCELGNLNERLRRAAVDEVKNALDLAVAAGAGGVVVHGGSARKRYPERVQRYARDQAVRSLRECTEYADSVGVPLCLENQRETGLERRHTATPDRIGALLEEIDIDTEYLRLTLDIGHAKASGVDYRQFIDRFGDRIHVVHLHDNDGAGDDHDPIPTFRSVVADVGAEYNVLEMKSLSDIDRCLEEE